LPYLKRAIPDDRHAVLVQFYSQTVQVTQELRIPIYHNVSANVIDYMAIALMISKVNWDVEQILTQHNAYVDILVNQLQVFGQQFDHINAQILPMPKAVYRTVWDQILDKIFYTMVEGYWSHTNLVH
jgi:syndetin